MKTKCVNQDTILYKTLERESYTENEIAQITDKLSQQQFKDWYGEGKKTSYGDPELVDEVFIINESGQKISLNDLLNSEDYSKRQGYTKDLTYIDKVKTLLDELKLSMITRINNFKGTDYAKTVEERLEKINELNDTEYVKALALHTEYILKTVESMERRFITYDKGNKGKLSKKDETKREVAFKEFLLQSSDFLKTFSKIDKLETPKVEGLEVGKLIKLLKDTENRVTELQNRIIAEGEALTRNKLEHLITDPEVRREVIDFLSAQVDESKFQSLLDALGDSHVRFLAAVDKYYKLNMEEKSDEVKEKQREWRKFVKDFDGDFNNFVDRISERIDGNLTGKFLQEYDPSFYDELFKYRDKLKTIEKLKGKDSEEYSNLLEEYLDWRKDNIEQKYTSEYYNALNLLIPAAREAKQKLDEQKSALLAKGIDKFTPEDYDELKAIEVEVKWLKSSLNKDGSLKTGIDLEIAKSVFQYSKELSKFYTTIGVRKKEFDKARKLAGEKGEDFLSQWDYLNTSEEFSKSFWDKFNELTSQFPNSKEAEEIRDEIKQLLLPYKNEKGEVDVSLVPDDVKKKVNKLEEKKSIIKKGLNANMDKSLKSEMSKRFRDLVTFVPSSIYLKTFAQKQEDLSNNKITKEEYNKWYKENHIEDIYTEETHPISMWTTMKPRNTKFIEKNPNRLWQITDIKPEYYNPNYQLDSNGYPLPKDKWLNNKFNNLSEKDKEGVKKIQELLSYLVEHNEKNLIRRGYFPAIAKDSNNLNKPAKDIVSEVHKTITESEEIVKILPFKYMKQFNQTPLPEIKEGMSEEEIEKTQQQRDKIGKENKLAHGKAINYDLAKTMENFIEAALTNKYKTQMEADIKLFREQLRHMKIKQTTATGTNIFDKLKTQIAGEKVNYETTTIGSNTEKHFVDWMEGVFYEDFEKDEGRAAEIASKIQDYTSLRNMAFNVFSGLNNQLVGNLMERIEGAGGQYFNYKEWAKGRTFYFNNSMTMLADRNKKESSNFLTAFLKEFDIMVSQDELNNKPDGLLKTAQHKLRMAKDSAYFLQHIGEHQVQNSTLIAMSNSHRIIGGEILNFNEFFEKKKLNIEEIYKNSTLEEALRAIDNNIEMKKVLTEEFETYTKVIDAYELKDGYSTLKEGLSISKQTIKEFKFRVIGINQRLHGIYNTEDAAMLQRYVVGRLGMQFRKWIRPSWNRRFGRKFGQKVYNERVRDYEEGMYVTTAKYLWSPFSKNWKEHKKNQEATALAVYHTLVKGFKESITTAKIRWHSMSEMEKANVRKTTAEFLFLVTVTALGFLAKGLRGSDDDDKKLKDKSLIFILYQADRLFGELSTFTPIGLVREGNKLFKSPTAIFGTFDDIGKLLSALFLYPFRDEEERVFNSGANYGDNKIGVYFQDLIPVWKQIDKFENMNTNNQRYGVFRGK